MEETNKEHATMALGLFVVILAGSSVVATVSATARDGYRRVPTRR
jgi:hypothetical protein